jgi:hypothetical protein
MWGTGREWARVELLPDKQESKKDKEQEMLWA